MHRPYDPRNYEARFDTCTGWITKFFPFIKDGSKKWIKRSLQRPLEFDNDSVPAGISKAPVEFENFITHEKRYF